MFRSTIGLIAETSGDNHWHSVEQHSLAIFSVVPWVDPIPRMQFIRIARVCVWQMLNAFYFYPFVVRMIVLNSIRFPWLRSSEHFCMLCLVSFRCPSFVRSRARVHTTVGWVATFPFVRGHGLVLHGVASPATSDTRSPARKILSRTQRRPRRYRWKEEGFEIARYRSEGELGRFPAVQGTEVSIHSIERYRSIDEDLDRIPF